MNFKHYFPTVAAIIGLMLFGAVSCTDKAPDEDINIDVQLDIPQTITLNEGDTECTFRVMFSKAPLADDMIAFEDAKGQKTNCTITLSGKNVKVALTPAIVSGSYKVYLVRGKASKLLGETSILILSASMQIDPATTVYGIISCAGEPVKNVVVSDGFEVAKTDENGMYQLVSEKYWGYVFMSVPSGYEAVSSGVFPKVHSILRSGPEKVERVDFELVKSESQDDHIMLMMGDMHLAKRNSDLTQFSAFTSEVNSFLGKNSGKKVYGITLGDMTWDLYWYDNNFGFKEYSNTINTIKGMQIFHTIGNHDHDMLQAGDFSTAGQFKNHVAPTYYSFNIGKVHYVIIDDIDCTNTGSGDRTYVETIVSDQLEWLKKDLAHVSKDTPLVFAMHAPLNNIRSASRNEFISIVDPYETVHVVSGHTHKVTNYNKTAYREHVSGAVCADWWWSGYRSGGKQLLSTDGSPGGYAVWNVAGKDFKWRYKATGRPDDYQFRTYDLNNVEFTDSNLANPADDSGKFQKERAGYLEMYPKSNANYVLINVWNWNDGWKITVKDENGKELKTDKYTALYDPLHIASRYCTDDVWKGNGKTTKNFYTQKNGDFFRVTAADADVDLTITVEDEFGNVYTEKMVRPKAFNQDTYK